MKSEQVASGTNNLTQSQKSEFAENEAKAEKVKQAEKKQETSKGAEK